MSNVNRWLVFLVDQLIAVSEKSVEGKSRLSSLIFLTEFFSPAKHETP